MKKCPQCGNLVDDMANACPQCGTNFPPQYSAPNSGQYGAYNQYQGPFNFNEYYTRNNAFDSGPTGKSRGIAGLLAILLGGIGVQYFYLGRVGAGLITILLTLITCGLWEIVTLVQGILMLVMTNQEFDRKYIYTNSSFPLF